MLSISLFREWLGLEAPQARIEHIRFETLTTRTLVLRPGWLGELPADSHVWLTVHDAQGRQLERRLPVRHDERGRLHLTVEVTRDDRFAELLAFRSRVGDRIPVRATAAAPRLAPLGHVIPE